MKQLVVLFIVTIVWSCNYNTNNTSKNSTLKDGFYRGTLEVQDTYVLPFVFEVVDKGRLKVFNAESVIETDEIRYVKDSVYIQLPVFEGYIAATFDDTTLKGAFIKSQLGRVVPFTAKYNEKERFVTKSKPNTDVSGVWEVIFNKDDANETYMAKGLFEQKGNKVTGTFRTTTGDYRFLEGVVDGDEMKLSTFDGAHAFLFVAKVTDSTMNGQFYSGNHWKAPFEAKRNASYKLPHETTLTFLKEGYEGIAFNFPDSNGDMHSLKDERFRDKVVLIQLMGTWCPNCLDESTYYVSQYQDLKAKGVEIVALAFEYAKNKTTAYKNIERLQQTLGIEYPILLAQYGTTNKEKAQEKLPMLNQILSYPTTVFIDKLGKVRKIHTGFNGPATGQKYLDYQNEFQAFVMELVAE
ncbi:MAG: TlpA family protein disulfide reductase [Flavobacteriaceae bacterium]|nr:TlpA family protein disulfide reductase [Flavobacteriaceae bacterium]